MDMKLMHFCSNKNKNKWTKNVNEICFDWMAQMVRIPAPKKHKNFSRCSFAAEFIVFRKWFIFSENYYFVSFLDRPKYVTFHYGIRDNRFLLSIKQKQSDKERNILHWTCKHLPDCIRQDTHLVLRWTFLLWNFPFVRFSSVLSVKFGQKFDSLSFFVCFFSKFKMSFLE